MNRLVLIGNGFDLAHGLKTSYADFIHWYKAHRVEMLGKEHSNVSKEPLCTIELPKQQALSTYVYNVFWAHKELSHEDFFDYIVQNTTELNISISPFFERIIKGIETKGWVDIEDEYYELLKHYAFDKVLKYEGKVSYIKSLNNQLDYLKGLLVKYLNRCVKEVQVGDFSTIKEAIYAPFSENDMSNDGIKELDKHKRYWEEKKEEVIAEKIEKFGLDYRNTMQWVRWFREDNNKYSVTYPSAFLLPDNLMFLNFNYTDTVQKYINSNYRQSENHIHGDILNVKNVIFGSGDELDEQYEAMKELRVEGCMDNIKSIRYMEAPNYKQLLRFIDSAPFQVLIMGHSCGNSDRTLLNTIFEHPKCISIKPYYYRNEDDGADNYIELVQNISRNFTNMKLMRDRVVDKTHCEPLVKH